MHSFKVEFHGFECIHTKHVINITRLFFSNVFRKVQVQIIFFKNSCPFRNICSIWFDTQLATRVWLC